MDYWRGAKDYDGGGLLGAVTPFRTTRVDCRDGCGNFGGHGTYDFKWITPCIVLVRVVAHGGNLDDWRRVEPAQGYQCDQLHVVWGKPA